MTYIRKIATARVEFQLPDTDEWAAEYGLDPADLDSIQSDVGEWIHNALMTVIGELPGPANTLRVMSVNAQIVSSEVAGGLVDSSGVAHGNIHEG